MTPADHAKPLSVTLKLHPETLGIAKRLAVFLNNSTLDHAVSEAILEAAKDKDFKKWLALEDAPQPISRAKGAA